MISIAYLTYLRLKEPAFLVLMAIGMLISYWLGGLGMVDAEIVSRASLLGSSNTQGTVLLGTILLAFLCGLINIFNAATEIPRDISTRMIAIYLSKPLDRTHYLIGKYLGTLGIGMTAGLLWITAMLVSRVFLHEGAESLTGADMVRQYLVLLYLIPVTAIAVGISCYFSDVLAMIICCAYIVCCFAATLVPVVFNILSGLLFMKILMVPYHFFPNLLYYFQPYDRASSYVQLAVYALATCLLFLLIGRKKFNRGDVF